MVVALKMELASLLPSPRVSCLVGLLVWALLCFELDGSVLVWG